MIRLYGFYAPQVLYGTTTCNSKLFADELSRKAIQRGYTAIVQDLKAYDPELLEVESGSVLVFIVSTYTDGTPPERWVVCNVAQIGVIRIEYKESGEEYRDVADAVFSMVTARVRSTRGWTRRVRTSALLRSCYGASNTRFLA